MTGICWSRLNNRVVMRVARASGASHQGLGHRSSSVGRKLSYHCIRHNLDCLDQAIRGLWGWFRNLWDAFCLQLWRHSWGMYSGDAFSRYDCSPLVQSCLWGFQTWLCSLPSVGLVLKSFWPFFDHFYYTSSFILSGAFNKMHYVAVFDSAYCLSKTLGTIQLLSIVWSDGTGQDIGAVGGRACTTVCWRQSISIWMVGLESIALVWCT